MEESGLDPYLRLTDPDPGGPTTYGSGSRTLATVLTFFTIVFMYLNICHCQYYFLIIVSNIF
jgi:hypothetical protein